ncbi:unnamed protein product [Penicillium nalgiovense]|nr:unnamed protein product [Penicillium nalgiovense]
MSSSEIGMPVFSECAQYIVSIKQFDNKGDPDNISTAEERQIAEGQLNLRLLK